MSSITRSRIVELARECLDTPFHHQGRQVGVGLDCAGVIVVIARALNYPLNDPLGYGRSPHRAQLEAAAMGAFDEIYVDDAGEGDILMMRFLKEPQHVGIKTAEGHLIHAYQQVDKCVEHAIDDLWRSRIVSAWRFRGLEQ